MIVQYTAREATATSSGQNDAGLFELNFRDERYLPFEFEGAVSRWRIELPQENNQFDVETLTDVILHLNYTAREGGDVLRQAANELAQRHLPGAGLRFFDMRHEFPDTWHSAIWGVRLKFLQRSQRGERLFSQRVAAPSSSGLGFSLWGRQAMGNWLKRVGRGPLAVMWGGGSIASPNAQAALQRDGVATRFPVLRGQWSAPVLQ